MIKDLKQEIFATTMSTDLSVSFHWLDYVVFAASLVLGLVIGVVVWVCGGGQKTKEEYLLGGKNLNPIVVGTSLLVSTLNAVFLLGGTAEVAYR